MSTGYELARRDAPTRHRPAWFEIEAAMLLILVACAFFTRLDKLPIRGDESNWAVVAQEMLTSGDWVVPRRQGEPFPDRPPLNSWCIAIASQLCGDCHAISVRLPSVLAVLITTLSVYVYSRQYLSRVGALAAAAAFASMAHELRMGRLAESDNLLTCCLANALFVWSAGYLRHWSPTRTWMSGYTLAALAALAKGPQGPVYFVAITTGFLLLRRDWRYLFSWSHLAGIATFAAVLGSWLVPFYLQTDWASLQNVWCEQGHLSQRFNYSDLSRGLTHLAIFPLWVLGAMLPWSFMLLPFASRGLRQSLGTARPFAQFLAVCWLVALPTVWLSTDSGPRYIMSMYPMAAALIGIAVARSWQATSVKYLRSYWSRFLIGSAVMFAGGVIVLTASGRLITTTPFDRLRQPAWLAVAYLLAACTAAAVIYWARRGERPAHAKAGILTVAGMMCVMVSGASLDVTVNSSFNPAQEVEAVRTRLPQDIRLVSLGPAHHRFLYYYHAPVDRIDWTAQSRELPPEIEYFCVTQYEGAPVVLPFDWEPVGAISCDRAPRTDANRVFIGRRKRATPPDAPIKRTPIIVAAGESVTQIR